MWFLQVLLRTKQFVFCRKAKEKFSYQLSVISKKGTKKIASRFGEIEDSFSYLASTRQAATTGWLVCLKKKEIIDIRIEDEYCKEACKCRLFSGSVQNVYIF
jgi:hypothetical protein